MKKALITGITGQDGAYLARQLLSLGYEVTGTGRLAKRNFWRLEELDILDKISLIDVENIHWQKVIDEINPDEFYHLAGQSSVAQSFLEPAQTLIANGMSTIQILEAIRNHTSSIRFYHASSAEIFGQSREFSKDETQFMHPRSPYAVSKMFSHWITVNYREAYQMYSCCGILFNHESPLRGEEFVTRKISRAVARIHLQKQEVLEIGNLNACRDWGYAPDYVDGMYRMLQQEKADDFVLATGKLATVREFVAACFACVGISLRWEGEGASERGYDRNNQKLRVKVNPQFFRPTELNHSLGNPIKAANLLKWESRIFLENLCAMMVQADVDREEGKRPKL